MTDPADLIREVRESIEDFYRVPMYAPMVWLRKLSEAESLLRGKEWNVRTQHCPHCGQPWELPVFQSLPDMAHDVDTLRGKEGENPAAAAALAWQESENALQHCEAQLARLRAACEEVERELGAYLAREVTWLPASTGAQIALWADKLKKAREGAA